MYPILLKIGPITIYSYGVMVALGAGLAAFLIYRRAGEFGLDKDKILDLAVLSLLSGLAGARLLYVALNLPYYSKNPAEAIDLSKGGLIWYGGFFAAVSVLIWYVKRRRLIFWSVVDLFMPYVALAQAFGRIGCFLNGCCYGIEAPRGYPAGVIFPGDMILRQPTQIYSSLALLSIFVILRVWQSRRRFGGEIFLGYCALYALKRFLVEFLRGDNPRIAAGFTMSQVISIVVFALSVSILAYKASRWRKNT